MAKIAIDITWQRLGPLWICEVLRRRAYGLTKMQATKRVFEKIHQSREVRDE